MRFREKKKAATNPRPAAGRHGGGQGAAAPRWRQAQEEIAELRRRVEVLEQELADARRLNKRIAEITDVVAEVLLPAEQRDEERMRAVLARYESGL